MCKIQQTVTKASSGSPVHNLSTGLDYTTIQEAVDANETLNGQTIRVDSGTYYENVEIFARVVVLYKKKGVKTVKAGKTWRKRDKDSQSLICTATEGKLGCSVFGTRCSVA